LVAWIKQTCGATRFEVLLDLESSTFQRGVTRMNHLNLSIVCDWFNFLIFYFSYLTGFGFWEIWLICRPEIKRRMTLKTSPKVSNALLVTRKLDVIFVNCLWNKVFENNVILLHIKLILALNPRQITISNPHQKQVIFGSLTWICLALILFTFSEKFREYSFRGMIDILHDFR
jgi:hypothetical protein